jgi:signal transduction histidine kinase
MVMSHYIAAEQNRGIRSWITKKRTSLGFIIVSCLLFFILFREYYFLYWTRIEENSVIFTFSVSASTVALIIAGTYFYTYRFFKQNFYFFLFISWIANAIYLIPDINGPSPSYNDYLRYRYSVLLLSLVSTGFMFLALRSRGKKKPDIKTWSSIFLVAVIFTALDIIVLYFTSLTTGLEQYSFLTGMMLLGSAISFVIIWGVGANLSVRLGGENYKGRARRIAYTFYIYALLQFVYPFFPYLQERRKHLLLAPFLIGQVVKMVNAILMMGVLQSARDKEIEDANMALSIQDEKLKRKNQLAELGAFAASIKHDIYTPLATMGSHIKGIKKRFQHNEEIIHKMEKLEQSMDRISAIVDVVDIVRGDKSYYDRDKFMDKVGILEVVHRAIRSVKDEKLPMTTRTVIKVTGREAWVRAFAPMLEQLVVNVVKNGLEAIVEAKRERGAINIIVKTIKIPESKYFRWVKIEINDNGCGIPQDNMKKLTTLFSTRSDKKPNSGLGLFMGKRIMNIHNGKIEFESIVGEGTKVTLLLPEWNAFQKAASETGGTALPETDDDSYATEDLLNDEPETETTYSEPSEPPESHGGNI